MIGHLIGLRFAITELLAELAVDTIQELVRVAKGEIEAGAAG